MMMDTELNDCAVCPYCGHEHKDSWEFHDQEEATCDSCGEEFSLLISVRYYYTTTQLRSGQENNK